MTDEQILADILRREGGFIHHPSDRGGCTNFGITLQTLSEWRGRPVTCSDVQALREQEARDIYLRNYVEPVRRMGALEEVRAQLTDIAVNSGLATARNLWRRAGNHNGRLAKERLQFYARIVQRRPSQAVFFAGWVNRAFDAAGLT